MGKISKFLAALTNGIPEHLDPDDQRALRAAFRRLNHALTAALPEAVSEKPTGDESALQAALAAACALGEPSQGPDDPRLRGPHQVELLPVITTGLTSEQLHQRWAELRKMASQKANEKAPSTDVEMHRLQRHPDWEYATTSNPRGTPCRPLHFEGDNTCWRANVHAPDTDGQGCRAVNDREERYWMRPRQTPRQTHATSVPRPEANSRANQPRATAAAPPPEDNASTHVKSHAPGFIPLPKDSPEAEALIAIATATGVTVRDEQWVHLLRAEVIQCITTLKIRHQEMEEARAVLGASPKETLKQAAERARNAANGTVTADKIFDQFHVDMQRIKIAACVSPIPAPGVPESTRIAVAVTDKLELLRQHIHDLENKNDVLVKAKQDITKQLNRLHNELEAAKLKATAQRKLEQALTRIAQFLRIEQIKDRPIEGLGGLCDDIIAKIELWVAHGADLRRQRDAECDARENMARNHQAAVVELERIRKELNAERDAKKAMTSSHQTAVVELERIRKELNAERDAGKAVVSNHQAELEAVRNQLIKQLDAEHIAMASIHNQLIKELNSLREQLLSWRDTCRTTAKQADQLAAENARLRAAAVRDS